MDRLITLDFQKGLGDVPLERGDVLDTRHFLYARNPTYTLESYLGYLNYVKVIAQRSAYNDYMLQLGFIPLIMPPSFWDDKAHTLILPKVQSHLPIYTRPAVSFLNIRYNSDYPDIWVSKMDAAEFCRCEPELVTVRGVLKQCGV